MICRQCNADYSPLLPGCPQCYQRDAKKPVANNSTRRLPDLSSAGTRRLVQLDSCPNCRFLLFPTDTACPSCGVPVRHGAKILTMEADPQPQDKSELWRKAAIGAAIGGVTIVMLLMLITLIRHI